MFYVNFKHKLDILNVNNEVDHAKKRHIKRYERRLSEYIDDVSRLALYKITDNKDFNLDYCEVTCSINDQLGNLLLNPPKLEDLSLPSFFEKGNTEIINLPRGYLYISLSKDKKSYTLTYHENIADLNPYLDIGRNISDTMPRLLRGNVVVGTFAYSVTRVFDLVKSIFKLI